jgi:hypothetical protein
MHPRLPSPKEADLVEEPSENGIVHTTMTLTVSVDAKTLSGTWYNFDEQEDIPFEVTRKTVGNCQAPD